MNGQALGRLLKEATDTQTLSGTTRAAKIFDMGTTVPTDTSEGYSTGCIFLKTDGGAGTAFYINEGTAASSAFAAVSGLTAAQEALLSAVAGTNTASKALIVDANKHIDVLETASLKLGASGSTTAVTSSAAELNILDGATVTAAELNAVADASAQDVAFGSGFALAERAEHACTKIGNMFYTQIMIDLTGVNSGGTAGDIVGDADTANAHIGQLVAAKHGTTIVAIRMTCLETPATGDDDIDLYSADEGTGTEDTAIGSLTNSTQLTNGGNLASGTVVGMNAPPNSATQYLYLVSQTGDANATYTAGKVLIELWGV